MAEYLDIVLSTIVIISHFTGEGPVDLPDNPEIGWGPGDEADAAGLQAITHAEPLITTKDGEVEIQIAAEYAMALREELKSCMIDESFLRNRAVIMIHDNIAIIKIRLSEKGDYALNVYGDIEEATQDLPNLLNYLIKVEADTNAKPFPKLHENGLGKGYLADRLGAKAISHPDGNIETDDGKIKIDFEVPPNFDLFFSELNHNEVDHNALAEYQKIENGQHSAHILLTLPEAGEYGLNCYVMDKNDPDQVYHVHTYLITSTQVDTIPMGRKPEDEEMGSGPIPVSVKGNTVVIPLPSGSKPRTTELIRRNAQDNISPSAVKVKTVGDDDIYTVDLVEKGEYKFEIFEYDENGMLKQVAEYSVYTRSSVERISADEANLLTAEELQHLIQERASTQRLLPDIPAIGWGPGDATAHAGLKALTHEQGLIETEDGTVELRFAMQSPMLVIQNLKHNELEELVLKQHTMMRISDNELVINVRAPMKGEYALKLFCDDKADGELPNVCNYLIKSLRKSGKKFPKLHEGGIGKGLFADHFNVEAITHPEGKIQSELGVIGVEFTTDEDVEMLYEICNNDLDNHLSDCVKVKSDGRVRNIDLILPQEGEYALNIYARKKGDTEQIYHVHTYFIESFQTDTQNLPPAGEPTPIETICVEDSKAIIKVPAGKRTRTTELLRKNHLTQMPEQVLVECNSKFDIYTVQLPQIGEYRFDVFEEHGNGTLDHIRQYQIIRVETLGDGLTDEQKAKGKFSTCSLFT